MVHHKDKKAAADFLDTAAGCMAVDKEEVVLAVLILWLVVIALTLPRLSILLPISIWLLCLIW